MPKSVSMSFSPIDVGRGSLEDGVHFEVRDDGALVGRLTVLRKKLRWWPQGAAQAVDADWCAFDQFMRGRIKTPKVTEDA